MQKLGRYHVQRRVEAFDGPIYVGSEVGSGRSATLTLVRLGETTPPERLPELWRSFYDEFRIAENLQHPHIAQLFEVFQEEGKIWIASELAPEKNLASLLSEGTPLSESAIIEVLKECAGALDYANEKGIVHRTVRPSNIGLQPTGTVRLQGFGLAQFYPEVPEDSPPSDIAYLAPELIEEKELDGRSDQFSLAAVAYEMLTGEAPYQGTSEQIRANIVQHDPLPADGLNPAIGAHAARVLSKALAKKKEERYATCHDFVGALERALAKSEHWAAGERKKVAAAAAGAGGGGIKISVTSFAGRPRAGAEVESLLDDMVAELAGGPNDLDKRASGASVTAVAGKVRAKGRESKNGAHENGAAHGRNGIDKAAAAAVAEPEPAPSSETRNVLLLVAASALIVLIALAWLYSRRAGNATPAETAVTAPGALRVATSELPSAAPGSAYSHTLAVEGGAAPYSWQVAEGVLPPGLTLDTDSGAIQGIPRVAGEYPFKVSVSDAGGTQAAQAYYLRVQFGLAVRTAGSLPNAIIGQLYQQKVEAEGGLEPYTWQITGGELPDGVSLDTDGLLVGRPRRSGSYEFQARVTDASKSSAEQPFKLRVGAGLTLTSSPELPASSVGSNYSHRLNAGGGAPPLRWSISGGSLPAGLNLERSSGEITGRPESAGRYNFEVLVRDRSSASAVQSFHMEVQSALTFMTAQTLPDANVSRVYAKPLELKGGNWPYRWSIVNGTLPRGLQLDEYSGTIRGTPEAAGLFEFDVQVRDAFQATAERHFALKVTTLLQIETAYDLPDALGANVYSQTLKASGGTPPYLWSVSDGSLPNNFALDSTTGMLRGVPTVRGDHRFTVEVSDGSGTKATRLLRLAVIPAVRFNDQRELPHGLAGEPYSHALAVSGGKASYQWTLRDGALPAGIQLNEATGVLAGTPLTPGKYRFAIQVADATDTNTQQYFELEVNPPAPGEIVWRGQLDKDGILMIHDGRYASTGTMTGALPGVPVKIDLEPRDGLTVVTAPARSNSWRVLVINATQPQTEIIIRWTPL